MDFESRDFIWANFQNSVNSSINESNLCSTCVAFEILKIAVCPGDCNKCEGNLITLLQETIPENIIKSHLDHIKVVLAQNSLLEELEKKLPLYSEKFRVENSRIERRVDDLMSVCEKLQQENDRLRDRVRILQISYLKSEDMREKVENEMRKVKTIQSKIEKSVQEYFEESRVVWETVAEFFCFEKIGKRVDRLDDRVIEEYAAIDKVAEGLNDVVLRFEKVKDEQESVKVDMKHCKNLDCAVEQVMEFHHKIYDLNKKIDKGIKDLETNLANSNDIEKANEEYKMKVLELRRKTSECLLKPN